MFIHITHRLALMILIAVPGASVACASQITMVDGVIYAGVTITRRDASALECYSQRGRIELPVVDIAKIDGVRMSAIPENTYPYVASLDNRPHIQPPSSASPRPPLTAATPGVPPGRKRIVAAIPPAPRPAPPSSPQNNTIPVASPFPAVHSPAASLPPTAYSSTSPRAAARMFREPAAAARLWIAKILWIILASILFVVLWCLSVLRVRRDARRSLPPGSRAWWIVALLLPIAGYLLYELKCLIKHWRRDHPAAAAPRREFVFLDADHRPIESNAGAEATGLVNAKGILQDALLDRASDVHIEPHATECRVRFRIDGILHPRMKFSPEDGLRLVSALKTVAQLDIAERRKAQDGRFGGRTGDTEVDFRAATTPSVHGEKLVLRILDQKTGLRGLSDLGMSQAMMERFAEVIQSRSGMILATGPTGSGKTSSLYAALKQLDAVRLNIVTIEDPVEYELPGATQIPVNIRAGVTYESGLRSILRQDPDVILVGEMRDLEAAQIALRSALTGHLVFTSLHTRDAIGTIHRLEEMGIERHLVASALFVVMSQRLVRVLCTACREAYPCTGKEMEEIGIELAAGEPIYRAAGCRRCEGSGYLGRTGIFEILVLDEGLRQEINAGTTEDDFTKLARKKGYRSYREDGAEKVLRGITSVDEVLKAT